MSWFSDTDILSVNGATCLHRPLRQCSEPAGGRGSNLQVGGGPPCGRRLPPTPQDRRNGAPGGPPGSWGGCAMGTTFRTWGPRGPWAWERPQHPAPLLCPQVAVRFPAATRPGAAGRVGACMARSPGACAPQGDPQGETHPPPDLPAQSTERGCSYRAAGDVRDLRSLSDLPGWLGPSGPATWPPPPRITVRSLPRAQLVQASARRWSGPDGVQYGTRGLSGRP